MLTARGTQEIARLIILEALSKRNDIEVDKLKEVVLKITENLKPTYFEPYYYFRVNGHFHSQIQQLILSGVLSLERGKDSQKIKLSKYGKSLLKRKDTRKQKKAYLSSVSNMI